MRIVKNLIVGKWREQGRERERTVKWREMKAALTDGDGRVKIFEEEGDWSFWRD